MSILLHIVASALLLVGAILVNITYTFRTEKKKCFENVAERKILFPIEYFSGSRLVLESCMALVGIGTIVSGARRVTRFEDFR